MVRIRLRRMGAKKKPTYRIIVADKRAPRDGRFIEVIGSYDPRAEKSNLTVHKERAAYWLSVGAQPSEAVARLLRWEGLLDESGKPIPLPEAEDTEAVAEPSSSAEAPEDESEAEPVAAA